MSAERWGKGREMELNGVHLLLTYACNLECDHCFTWGSPRNRGTMALQGVQEILRQAQALGSVKWIYFEGGEPFLYYPLLARGVELAADLGFKVGIVTNTYWATTADDARLWLEPLAGKMSDLSLSTDLFHGEETYSPEARRALEAARELGIPTELLMICEAGEHARADVGQLPGDESAVMHRGRAADKLVHGKALHVWHGFGDCPHEDLRQPGRVHVDPLGHVHICQGISLGNVFEDGLVAVSRRYNPDTHPVIGPLVDGGPAELARRYEVPCGEGYVDACHLCYRVREGLRERFPNVLTPDQMYGVLPAC